MNRITYYAIATQKDGRIGQLFVTRKNGRQVEQRWTGVTYRSPREGHQDVERLNCGPR